MTKYAVHRNTADLLNSKTLNIMKEHLRVDKQRLYHFARRKQVPPEESSKPKHLLLKLTFAVGSASGVKICSGSISVLCQAHKRTRISGLILEETVKDDPRFDWDKFFALLWPHIWYLLAAIAVGILHIVL